MRLISARTHGVVDYLLALCFIFAPQALTFGPVARPLSHFIGVAYLAGSLTTRYPLGTVKLLSFPLHGVLETVMAAWWLFAPWLHGFSADPGARNFFVLAGAGLLAVVVLTDYRTSARRVYRGAERRQSIIERRHRPRVVVHERRRRLVDRRSARAAA